MALTPQAVEKMLKQSWKRFTWWRKTRVLAGAFLLLSLVITLALCLSLENAEANRATLNWVAFSLFPLIAVCLIAAFGQMQSSLNDTRGALSNFSNPNGDSGTNIDNASR